MWGGSCFRISGLDVRFCGVIGQAGSYRQPGCPILWSYRTSRSVSSAWLSDTVELSYKQVGIISLAVRFFGVIGQQPPQKSSPTKKSCLIIT